MDNPESELIAELRALAAVGNVDRFVLEGAPHPIEVSYSSGSSSSLTFVARYDAVARRDHEAILHPGGTGAYRRSGRADSIIAVRPLAITLRNETSGDVGAKQEGINVEYQTGDEKFDRHVYIETPTTDAYVLGAVLGPRVRQGVLALLVLGFSSVKIDVDGRVEAFLCQFTSASPRPGRGKSAVEAFALVLSDLPAISASGGAHVLPPFWARGAPLLFLSIGATALAFPASCAVAEKTNCTESSTNADGETSEWFRDGCGTGAFLAAVFAFFFAVAATVVVRAVARRRLRGHSDSAERILNVAIATFWATAVLAYAAASSFAFVSQRH
jgi:hypothetical protein